MIEFSLDDQIIDKVLCLQTKKTDSINIWQRTCERKTFQSLITHQVNC